MSRSPLSTSNRRRVLHFGLALRFVWRATPGWTLVSLALVFMNGPLPLVSLYLMKLMVDKVTEGVTAGHSVANFDEVTVIVVLMGATGLLGTVVSLVSGLVNAAQSMRFTDYMENVVHAKALALDLEYYEDSEYYDMMSRAQQQARSRPLAILQTLVQLGQSAITLLAMAGLLLVFHWAMVLVLVGTVVPSFAVRTRYSRRLYNWRRERTETERRASYYSWLITGDRPAKEVRLFELGDLLKGRFRDIRQRLRQEQLRLLIWQALASFGAQTVTTVAIYGCYAFIAFQTLDGAISLGSLVMYYQAFQRGQGSLRQFMGGLASLYEHNLFLADMFEFLNLEPKIVDPPHPAPMPMPFRQGIKVENVSFHYPGTTRTVLHDINLTIQPGEKIALVGENGSGKTTLIKLLCRLYDPIEGRITVDGIDLRDLKLLDFRREIGAILQDYEHYSLTAGENIWFGNVLQPPDQESIQMAASQAGAHEVISGLKDGYETMLGKLFEGGEELSIGQWQKVALARAFLRDAQLIILDEPTSSMDARAEYEVFQKLRDLTEGRAVILISHRFSTVRMADCIYVMDGGRIVERGSHDELMALGGLYAQLFMTQAQHYQ